MRLGARPTTFYTNLLMSEILAPGMKSTLALCVSMVLSIESPGITFSHVVVSGAGLLFKCPFSLVGLEVLGLMILTCPLQQETNL